LATQKDNEDFGKYQLEIDEYNGMIGEFEGAIAGFQADIKASKDLM